VLAQTQCFFSMLSVDEEEAMSLLYALKWVEELHVNNVNWVRFQ